MTDYREPVSSRQYHEMDRARVKDPTPLSASARAQKAFKDSLAGKGVLRPVNPPKREIHDAKGVPFASQEHALESVTREQARLKGKDWDALPLSRRVKLLREARGIAVDRKDFTYKPDIPNLESFQPDVRRRLRHLPTYKVEYSHNSALNGTSFMKPDGTVQEVTHGVSASDYRLSPTMHLLRRVSDERTGETTFYTGRPETAAKVKEQAAFVAAQEIRQGAGGKITRNADGSYTMPYVVCSFLPSSAVIEQGARFADPLSPNPEFERRYIEQERAELARIAGTPIEVEVDGVKHQVTLRPILVHQQLNNLWDHGERAPTWLLGEGRSKEILRKGLEELRSLARGNPEAEKYLNALEVDNLTPEEMLFHTALLCRALKLPQILHCKSSKDKTGLALAHTMAAYNWTDSKLPYRPELILGKKEARYAEERELVTAYKSLFTAHLLDLADAMSQYGMGGQGTLVGEELEDMHGLTIKECPLGARFLTDPYVKTLPTWRKIVFGFKYLFGPAIYSAPMAAGYLVLGLVSALLTPLVLLFTDSTLKDHKKYVKECFKKFGLHLAMTLSNVVLGAIPTAAWGLVRLFVCGLIGGLIALPFIAIFQTLYRINPVKFAKCNEWSWAIRDFVFDSLKYGLKDMSRIFTFYKAIPRVKYSEYAKENIIFKRKNHPPKMDPKAQSVLEQGMAEYDQLMAHMERGSPLSPAGHALLVRLGRQTHSLKYVIVHNTLKKNLTPNQIKLIKAVIAWKKTLSPVQKIDYLPESIYHHMLLCANAENPRADRMTKGEKELFLQLYDQASALLAGPLSARQRELIQAIHKNGEKFLGPVCLEKIENLNPKKLERFKRLFTRPLDVNAISDDLRPLFKATMASFFFIRHSPLPLSETTKDLIRTIYKSQVPLWVAVDGLSEESYERILRADEEMTPKELEFLLLLRNEAPWALQQEELVALQPKQKDLLEAAARADLSALVQRCTEALSTADFTKLETFLQDLKADPYTLSPHQQYLLTSLANLSASRPDLEGLSPRTLRLIELGRASTLPAFVLPPLVTPAFLNHCEPPSAERLSEGIQRYRDTGKLNMQELGTSYIPGQNKADLIRDSFHRRITFVSEDQDPVVIDPRVLQTPEDQRSYMQDVYAGLRSLPPLQDLEQMPTPILGVLSQTALTFRSVPTLHELTLANPDFLPPVPHNKVLSDCDDEYIFRWNRDGDIIVDLKFSYTIADMGSQQPMAKFPVILRYTFRKRPDSEEWDSGCRFVGEEDEARMAMLRHTYNLTPKVWLSPPERAQKLKETEDYIHKDRVEGHARTGKLAAPEIDPEKRSVYRGRAAALFPEKAELLKSMPYADVLRKIEGLQGERQTALENYLRNPNHPPKERELLVNVANWLIPILRDAQDGVILLTEKQRAFLALCKESNVPMFRCIRVMQECPPDDYQPGKLRDTPNTAGFVREFSGVPGAVELIRGDIVDLVCSKKPGPIPEGERQAWADRLRGGLRKVRALSDMGPEMPDLIKQAFTLNIYQGLLMKRSSALNPKKSKTMCFGKAGLCENINIEIHDLGPNDIRIRYIQQGKIVPVEKQGETLGTFEASHSLYLHKREDGSWEDTRFDQTEWLHFKFERARDENFVS